MSKKYIKLLGWMKYRRKLGYTLIECVIYLSASLLVVCLGTTIFMEAKKIYYKSIKENMALNIVEEGFNLIDIIKNGKSTSVYVSGDRVIFRNDKAIDGWESVAITQKGPNLSVEYYDSKHQIIPLTTNVIITKIKSFKVVKKEKLIYLIIEREGEKFIKCI